MLRRVTSSFGKALLNMQQTSNKIFFSTRISSLFSEARFLCISHDSNDVIKSLSGALRCFLFVHLSILKHRYVIFIFVTNILY